MAAPIDLRNDFDSVSLRRLAKRTRDATQSRRLLALAEVYDGGSRTDASRIGGVGLQIIRDWVLRFNARGPDGLVDGKSPGAPSKLNADHRRALAEVVEAGPVPAVDGVVPLGNPQRESGIPLGGINTARQSPVGQALLNPPPVGPAQSQCGLGFARTASRDFGASRVPGSKKAAATGTNPLAATPG